MISILYKYLDKIFSIKTVLDNFSKFSKNFKRFRKIKKFSKINFSKLFSFRNLKPELSKFYNLDNIHKVEVFSLLYKREMHLVINENTKGARVKDLEKLADFEWLKSYLISRYQSKIFVLLSLQTPKLHESCKLEDFYENFWDFENKYNS